jgi:hypothetical protein
MVRIESRPEGAVVKLRDRVFGRAPLNLRFNSGITYELTFVKSGYESNTRRFTVTKRRNQKIVMSLKKRPAPRKKGLLQRLFGG